MKGHKRKGWLSEVSKVWEKEAMEGGRGRRVVLRLAPVITQSGGVLGRMIMPFKLGGGGVIGSGKQVREDEGLSEGWSKATAKALYRRYDRT